MIGWREMSRAHTQSGSDTGALYHCRVMHHRPGKPSYRFVYRVFYLLTDLDGLGEACRSSPLISRNRFNLLSFYDADHGAHDGSDLRSWAESILADHAVELAGGRIRLLAMPRVLGYGFNPISLYYCDHADGRQMAVIVEVHNTFGEHHIYVLPADPAASGTALNQHKNKRFHVSPFFDRSGYYRFHVLPPEARLGLGVRLHDEQDRLRIATTLSGEYRPLTTGSIWRAALAMPLMSLKVIGAIHWQALKIWLRGAIFHARPNQERHNVS